MIQINTNTEPFKDIKVDRVFYCEKSQTWQLVCQPVQITRVALLQSVSCINPESREKTTQDFPRPYYVCNGDVFKLTLTIPEALGRLMESQQNRVCV